MLRLAIVFLLPLLVLSVTPGILLQNGMLDPFIYTAYIHDYRQLYAYFGSTYYSTRISAIDLSRVVTAFAGAETGYYVVRYLLLVTVSGSTFAIARRFYGTATAALAAVLVCLSPWYLRSIAWDYVDGSAITYLFAAFAFVMAPRRRVVLSHTLAGVCFALAVNTNLFALAIAGSFAPSWFILRGKEGLRRSWPLVAAVVGGFLLAYGVLMIVMHVEFPDRPLFFEKSTLSAVNYLLLDRQSATYFTPLSIFLQSRHFYIFVPVLVWIAMVILLVQTMRRPEKTDARTYVLATTTYLTVIIVVYLINHFGLHHARITLTYYFSYVLIASFLAVIALLGEALTRVERKPALVSMTVAAGIYVVAHLWYSPDHQAAEGGRALSLWAATAIACPLGLVAIRRPTPRLWTLLVFLLAMPLPFYYSSEDYSDLHSPSRKSVEWDVYRGALYLQRVIGNQIVPRPGAIKFWYDASLPNHGSLNSVQSIYLWGFSRIPQMPRVDAEFTRRIAGVRYLVVLGMSNQEVDAALTALSRAGIGYRLIRRDTGGGPHWSFDFGIVELPKANAAPQAS